MEEKKLSNGSKPVRKANRPVKCDSDEKMRRAVYLRLSLLSFRFHACKTGFSPP